MNDIYLCISEIPIIPIILNVYFHDSCIRILFIDEVFHSFSQLYRKMFGVIIISVYNAFNQSSISRIIQIYLLILLFDFNYENSFNACPFQFVYIIPLP